MKKRLLCFPVLSIMSLALLLSFVCASCKGDKNAYHVTIDDMPVPAPPPSGNQVGVPYSKGNYSYVPLNKYGNVAKNLVPEIIDLLDTFEKDHPDLEITNWTIEYQPAGYGKAPDVYGIWISHRKKAAECK